MRAGRGIARGVLIAALASTVIVTPAVAQDRAQELEEVVEQREALEEDLNASLAEHDELLERLYTVEDELATLEADTAALLLEAEEAGEALESRARFAFMLGDAAFIESMLQADGPQDALDRARMLATLSRRDVGQMQTATALREQLEQNRVLLADKQQELVELEAQLQAEGDALQTQLEDVREEEHEIRTLRDRQVRLERGAQTGIYACLIEPPYTYRSTWGAPRSGGRRHKGTDVMGVYGANVYAFTDGVIKRFSSSGLGGRGLYLMGDDGVEYYYAHLSDFASSPGQRVDAGELIAFNGNSGNARGGAPHVHFEVHPGGGGPIDPYPWVNAVC